MSKYFLFFTLLSIHYSNAKNNQTEKPKLVVAIVVDQMRYDFLENLSNRFTENGFKRLIDYGYNCKNNYFNYVPTVTGPGHSSISTGSTPMTHGVVGNNWYDREKKESIYCANDSDYRHIGGDAYSGNKSPNNLLVDTFADVNKLSNNNDSKTISVAIKDRGSILMGGKTADAAYWYYGKERAQWITSNYYMNELPDWVNNFNNEDNLEKYLEDWVTFEEITNYDNYEIDDNNYEKQFKGKDNSAFPYSIKSLMKHNDCFDMIKETPYGNSMTTDFAIEAIINENLGKSGFTDVLTIGYSSTDYVGHNFGVASVETQDVYIRLDREIAKLLSFLDKEIGENQYTLFLTGDHGVLEIPAFLSDSGVNATAISKEDLTEKALRKLYNVFAIEDEKFIVNVENNQIYLNDERIRELNLDKNIIIDELVEILQSFDFITNAYSAEFILNSQNLSGYEKLIQNGFHKERSGDIAFILKPNVIFHDRKGTTHGSGYNYDTHVPLIFYGNGIKNGETLDYTEIPDIAPTISELLGQKMKNSTGKILDFILKK
ncbi:MAG: alkaline phosphatase family protein [Bacteroidetes bacterium]|nr:MAG: alkaline phosphatase family protein [Bacteroidota bacterium]